MTFTAEHDLAMFCLPVDGRWQSEAQLIGQTELGKLTCLIYRELKAGGFVERRMIPIICGKQPSGEFVWMYRAPWKLRKAYQKVRRIR